MSMATPRAVMTTKVTTKQPMVISRAPSLREVRK
jgi:hypothetical protein